MSKYLVRYNVKGYSLEYQKSIIYNTDGDMTEKDVIEFEHRMSKKEHNAVTMISFNKLVNDRVEESNTNQNTKITVFFLFDTEDKETVMVYTDAKYVVSYNFIKDNAYITLKDDEGNINVYSCPIPGIWFGDGNVLDNVPDILKKQYGHPYLFNADYKNYAIVK